MKNSKRFFLLLMTLALCLLMSTAVAAGPTAVSTAAALKAAVENGESVVLTADFSYTSTADAADQVFATIPAGKNVVIDFAGHTITVKDSNPTASFQFLENRGTLTLQDSSASGQGGVAMSAVSNRNYNALSAILNNLGSATIQSGVYRHTGGTSLIYGVDNNSTSASVSLTVNGGAIETPYTGIRAFQNSEIYENNVTINGGTVKGKNSAVDMWSSNNKNNKGALAITGGQLFSQEYSVLYPCHVFDYNVQETKYATNLSIRISGGTFSGATGIVDHSYYTPFHEFNPYWYTADSDASMTISACTFRLTGDDSYLPDHLLRVPQDVPVAKIVKGDDTLYAVSKSELLKNVSSGCHITLLQGELTADISGKLTVTNAGKGSVKVNGVTITEGQTVTFPIEPDATPADPASVPRTGDGTPLGLWLGLMLLSVAAMTLTWKKSRA